MKRLVEGTIVKLRCMCCEASIPSFQFSGDTDMATMELGAATCCSTNEVALSEMLADEFQDRDAGLSRFAMRLSDRLQRDFRAVPVLRVERRGPEASSLSFREFRRSYVPPKLVFVCPLCGGEATEVEHQSPVEFANTGGILTLVGNIELV